MKLLTFAFVCVLLLSLYSCSDTTSPSNLSKVKIEMGFDGYPSVSAINKTTSNINALTVDSIFVQKVRILIKQIKFHVDNDSAEFNDDNYKAGPFVLTFDYGALTPFTLSSNITPGLFDKIKVEFHRFSSSELAVYANNSVFKDFATNDRYSVIIEGKLFTNGKSENFTFNSNMTANLEIELEDHIKLEADKLSTFKLLIQPSLLFKKGLTLLDPRETKNQNDLDNAIKSMLKMKLK